MKNNEETKGILYIVISASCFGIMPILAKMVYSQGINAYSLLFFRFLFAAIMLSVYLKIVGISFGITLKQFMFMMCISTFGYALTAVTLFLSYNYISVGVATMILYTYPAIVTVLGFIIYKEKIYRTKLISLIFCLIGCFMLVSIKSGELNVKGVILAFLSSMLFSFYVIGASHKCIRDINSYLTTFYMSAISCLVIFIIGAVNNNIQFKMNFYSYICIMTLSFVSTIIALITFLKGVKLIGPSKAAIFSTLEPIVSLILGIVVLKETVRWNVVIGSSLVVLGVIILATKQSN